MKDLKARKYSPVYVLMGEEPFYIDKICDYISENVLQPEERDFNQTVVFGADATGAQVADLCKGYPMMAEYRVGCERGSEFAEFGSAREVPRKSGKNNHPCFLS